MFVFLVKFIISLGFQMLASLMFSRILKGMSDFKDYN